MSLTPSISTPANVFKGKANFRVKYTWYERDSDHGTKTIMVTEYPFPHNHNDIRLLEEKIQKDNNHYFVHIIKMEFPDASEIRSDYYDYSDVTIVTNALYRDIKWVVAYSVFLPVFIVLFFAEIILAALGHEASFYLYIIMGISIGLLISNLIGHLTSIRDSLRVLSLFTYLTKRFFGAKDKEV
jgi:hypothetical protein